MNKKFLLNEDWKFKINEKTSKLEKSFLKEIKSNEWLDAKVPGTVLTDLLNHELIPDPFFADNELKLQWIGENDWIYATSFNYPKDFEKNKKNYLVFEGIDTVSKIFLNGKELGISNNMFLKYEFEISDLLKKKRNKLEIYFTSPIKFAKELESKFGRLSAALNSERVYIRKAQYSFGWDWGPKFPVMGIWRPVYLIQRDNIHIENFVFNTLAIEEGKANLEVKINLTQPLSSFQRVELKLTSGEDAFQFEMPVNNEKLLKSQFEMSNPKLWWPNGLGEQNLYDLSIKIIEGGEVLDKVIKKVGIRTIKLILNENEKKTFKFEINNFPIFARGANWIPGDCFLPLVTEEKYRSLLTLAKEANMNIIRVWGGGIYENDIFYEICDELGLLVWQDFMFACAPYPEYDKFLNNVEEEINYNVYRLQYHPCIAVWCGNNENEWTWYRQQKDSYKKMSGYKIFNELIPNIIKEIDPGRAYRQSSPFGDEEDPNSMESGNRHQWDLWSGWKDYTHVKYDQSLFVTEFGFQAPANQSTLEEVIPEEERNLQSYLFEFHNKQIEGNERLVKFLYSHLPVKTKWKDFIYLAQLNQALALKECLEHWRYNQPQTNGSIIWQLNDTWPVSSWSLIDSRLRPKLSYYFVKKLFQNQSLFLNKKNNSLEVSMYNNDSKVFSGWLEMHNIYLPKGKVKHIINKKFRIKEYGEKEIISLTIPSFIENGNGIIVSSLYGEDGKLLQRNYYSKKEWKHIKLPEVNISIKLRNKKEHYAAEISANKPAFFVNLQNPDFIFKDNGLIILPEEKVYIGMINRKSKSKSKKETECLCLNQYLK